MGTVPSLAAPLLVLAVLLLAVAPRPVRADTGLDLSGRMVIDGFANEYQDDETLFQLTPEGFPEESSIDSQWGRFNDINNIRLTWDANYLYVAVEGYIFDNNMMIFFDTLPSPDGQNPGWTDMSSIVGGWRRAVSFDNGINPEAFLATWDGNSTPQLWTYTGPSNDAQVPVGSFPTVATFSRDLAGRAMEAAIPWDVLFLGQGERAFNPAYGDTVYNLPAGADTIKLVAWITTGADGGGGPDSAPDNLSGHQVDSAVPVVLDNYIKVVVDSLDAQGNPGADGVPDFGVPVRHPTTPGMTREEYDRIANAFFFYPPPVRGVALELSDLKVSPRVISPEEGTMARFSYHVKPDITDERLRAARQLSFTAELYDMYGRRVRTIYRDRSFYLSDLDSPDPPAVNVIDGRNDHGAELPGGIYVLRLVLEPGQDEIRRALSVVR